MRTPAFSSPRTLHRRALRAAHIRQAFQQFHAKVPNSFLYLKAISSLEILRQENKNLPITIKGNELSLDDLFHALGFPMDVVKVDTMIRSYDDSLRLMAMADVLLQPSKVEGFGMPVLEAQLLGTPVVTTKWQAIRTSSPPPCPPFPKTVPRRRRRASARRAGDG